MMVAHPVAGNALEHAAKPFRSSIGPRRTPRRRRRCRRARSRPLPFSGYGDQLPLVGNRIGTDVGFAGRPQIKTSTLCQT